MLKVFTFLLAIGVGCAELSKYSREAFTFALLDLKVPESDLPNWVCIAEKTSSFSTYNVHKNADGTRSFGVFGIHNRGWCQDHKKNRTAICGISCQSLLTDKISTSYECAKKVVELHGYTAFPVWKYCKKNIPNLKHAIKEYKSRYNTFIFDLA